MTEDRIDLALQEHREEFVSFLQDIVRADTRVIGHGIDGGLEWAGQQLIIERLKKLPCKLDVFEPDNSLLDRYRAANRGHIYQGRPNVVATFPGTGGGRSLILNGHIDTMPYGDRRSWRYDPFSGHIENGILYGLGSADMKAGLIGFLMGIELVGYAGIRLMGDVIFQSVVDEEGGGNGTLACLDRGYRADGALVAEPTSFEVQPAHMGFLFYKVEVSGRSVHSSRKWRGVNAIEKAFILIEALYELERRWMMEKRHPLLPPPTLNIGEIHGGSAGSTVPGECYFTMCLHYLPQDVDDNGLGDKVEQEVLNAIAMRCRGDEWLAENPPQVTRYQEGSPFEIPLPHPLLDSAVSALRKIGRECVVSGMPAGCDARYFPTVAKTPCLIIGPGDPEQAHAVNEHVVVEDYLSFIEFTARFIVDWCGVHGRGAEQ